MSWPIVVTVLAVLLAVAGMLVVLLARYIKHLKVTHQQELDKKTERARRGAASAVKGLVTEQVATLLPGWPYEIPDVRHFGDPIDFVVFEGYNAMVKAQQEKAPEAEDLEKALEVVLVEFKVGEHARPSKGQNCIRDAVERGAVRYELIRVVDNCAERAQVIKAPRIDGGVLQ